MYSIKPKEYFKQVFDSIEDELKYEERFVDDQGYFSNAVNGVYAPEIKEGSMRKCVSFSGRRVIFVGTSFGNVAVFDRFSNDDNQTINCNTPEMIKIIYNLQGPLSVSDIKLLLGDKHMHVNNIGERLSMFTSSIFANNNGF